MRKGEAYAALFLLGMSLVGCTGKTGAEETQADTKKQVVQETESQIQTETDTEAETEKKTEAVCEEPISTVIGSLTDIDMGQITVLSDNGNEIIFSICESELDFRSGFRVGNLVAVTYQGELVKADSRKEKLTVWRVSDSADVEELEEEKESDERVSGKEGEIKTVRGTLQKMDRNSVTIVKKDGEEQSFPIMNAHMYFGKGMAKGIEVVVSYREESDDTPGVISVIDAASAKKWEKHKLGESKTEGQTQKEMEKESETKENGNELFID